MVFFAGDRADKLEKPVALGFLEFTSQQARVHSELLGRADGCSRSAMVRQGIEAIRPDRPEYVWRPVRPVPLPD